MMNRVQKKFVCDALDNEHLLTEWELEFLNNLVDRFDDRDLTEKQNEVLNRINTKVNRG